jgi:hypothetical protein
LWVTHGWLRYDYSHYITEILLKVALNTRTHNHSSDYSLLIMCGSTFREILVSLQKKAIDSYWSKSPFDIVNILAWAEKIIQNHFGPQYFESNSCLVQIHLRAVIWLTITKVVLKYQSVLKRPRYYQDFSASWVPVDEWREIRA